MPEWLIWFLIFSWGGPIGLGVLMAGLGVMYWGEAQKKKAAQE